MTDLLHVIPDLPTKPYAHLLPSLENNLITTVDLLTLEPSEISKRARLPGIEVVKLRKHAIDELHAQLGFNDAKKKQKLAQPLLKHTGKDLVNLWTCITTLDPALDGALGGGIHTGYVTEIVGESGSGKTTFLLNLLLTSQLPQPQGLNRTAIYISTEAALATNRLTKILFGNPAFRMHEKPPSLKNIFNIQTLDLESQEHVITFQLPLAIAKHDVGLVVIDSIAANYRAERMNTNRPAALAERSGQLLQLGSQLRKLAREHNCAIVVANQVADRFAHVPSAPSSSASQPITASSSPHELASSNPQQPSVCCNPMTLNHQMRFFSGWGSNPSADNLKTPALGLVWTNQIAARVALLRKEWYGTQSQDPLQVPRADTTSSVIKRWLKVAFAPWIDATSEASDGHEFELWEGGIRSII